MAFLTEPQLREALQKLRLVAFDFDGVFTDNAVYVNERGEETVRCTRADGFGIRKLEQLGLQTIVISTEINPVVSARCRKLKIECIQGVEDKRQALDTLVNARSLQYDQIAFIGNDINDLPALMCVGLPMIVQDAHPDVIPYARYQTKTRGGYGAVREVGDLFARLLAPQA